MEELGGEGRRGRGRGGAPFNVLPPGATDLVAPLGWGLRVGVEMGTYWRPTVPNPHASPKVQCAVSEI